MKRLKVIKLTNLAIEKKFSALPISEIERKHIQGKHTEEMNKAELVYLVAGGTIKILKNRNGDCGIVTTDQLDIESAKCS